MALAPTPCLDCGEPATSRGRCAVHQRKGWEGRSRRERLPSDWATRRRVVLNRDGRRCWVCGGEGADQVDHVKPGDDHSLGNLRAIHGNVPPFCHRYKTSAEGNAARRGQRARRYPAR